MKLMKFLQTHLKDKKTACLYLLAFSLLLICVLFSLLCGSTDIPLSTFQKLFTGEIENADKNIILFVRLPRSLASMVTGSALSVSGAIIQKVLNNNLASPSVIGINSGAGLAVTICACAGIYGGFKLSLFAFIGAFLAILIVSLTSLKFGFSRSTVILTGIAINSILGAFSDIIVTFNPEISTFKTDFKIGDFSSVTYQKLIPASIIIVLTITILLTFTNELDILSLGIETAQSLGINTKVITSVFLIFASLLASAAVSLAGLLSFVGLIVPHIIRQFGIKESSKFLPLCALYGAIFVTFCDTISRTAFAPYEIPVGIIMSLLGGPFFIFILIRKKGGHKNA